MSQLIALKSLKPGEQARIVAYVPGLKTGQRQQLLAMGLTKNTVFTVLRRAPLGDPVQISVRGFTLSLRQSESDLFILERVPA